MLLLLGVWSVTAQTSTQTTAQTLTTTLISAQTSSRTVAPKPRILISSDIGGTDPDDNQSMTHLLMFSDLFEIEGLVSSPSFGDGSKAEILRMIDLYAADFEILHAHNPQLIHPDSLRPLCKQGRRGTAPFCGYDQATEGSQWIVECARRKSDRPLWILVWGALEDVAQALHDAPDIRRNIRVYWIGGPNKKWGVHAYNYIASRFPDLWMIENNASYRGFIASGRDRAFYEQHICNRGRLGADFVNYYNGSIKMGDSPSLFYLMQGNPEDPTEESWGGQFEPMPFAPRSVLQHPLSAERDSVAVYAVTEIEFRGAHRRLAHGTPCFTATIDKQEWEGVYAGRGRYVLRYAAKAPAVLTYVTHSDIAELDGLQGSFVVSGAWPGVRTKESYPLKGNWYTDCGAAEYFEGAWQGAATVRKWRSAILDAWARRWVWYDMPTPEE